MLKKDIPAYINNNMIFLIDTKEKKFDHIISFLKRKNINYIMQSLNVGDYSFIFNGEDFSDRIIIERKANLDEIVGNFTGHVLSTKKDEYGNYIKLSNRDRFKREFLRMPIGKKYLLIENSNWGQIYRHNYRSKIPPESLSASLYTFQHRYNINVMFASKEYTPHIMYGVFFYYLREKILNEVTL